MTNDGLEGTPVMGDSASRETIDELNAKASQLVNMDASKSLKYAEHAQRLCTSGRFSSHPYKEGLADSLNVLCDVNLIFGDSQLSMEQGEKAMILYKAQNNLEGQAKVLSIQGFNYYVCGDFPKATDRLLMSLKLARETANLAQEGKSLSFLALVYYRSGEEKKSVEAFEKSIEISASVKDELALALTYNNLAMTYSEMKEDDKALDFSQKSLELCDKLGLDGLKIALLDTIGNIYMQIKNYTQAEKYFYDVINQIKKSKSYKHTHMVSLFNLGRIHLELGKEESALSDLFQALKIAEEMDYKLEQFRIHKLLSDYYEKKEVFSKSLLHHKNSRALRKRSTIKRLLKKYKILRWHIRRKRQKKRLKFISLKMLN